VEEMPKKGEKETEQPKQYALPDGTLMSVGSERFAAAEVMFNPSIIGNENAGVHMMIVNSIKKADMDLREGLYKNIYLSGGNSMIAEFPTRLAKELGSLPFKTNLNVYLR
jgi:centractin